MATNGDEASGADEGSESEVAELRQKVESLQQELKNCKKELTKLQKQLIKSERLQKSTESYNEDLRKQVDKLNTDIHERKKKVKERVEAETQTEQYTWSETDYYNYYYGSGIYQNDGLATDTQGTVMVEGQELTDASAMTAVEATTDTATDTITDTATAMVTEGSVEGGVKAANTQEVDAGSIADMLRATAQQAMTQTGFVFDETTGMYYDHSTGFYYDSASQLYYDNNTGMYYYYDAESGKYQFHSRIEISAEQPASEAKQEKKSQDKKSRKWKKGPEKASHQDDKGLVKVKDEELELEEWVERRIPKRGEASRRPRDRSLSPDAPSRRKRAKSAEHSPKKKRKKDRSHSDVSSLKRNKKTKSEKPSRKKKKKKRKKAKSAPVSRSDDSSGNSEPEEGEITESEGEWRSTSSSSSSSPLLTKDSSESEMESQEVEEVWPPCVRVTVVRSPVLQTGTLFIITADSPATIGREKEMNHAIRISEMGISKFHAEVYFDQDQQCYMLVDQGSQNGTVLNGNRILQPKAKCEPCPLTHGDEVKMGETVLSFHIHSGTDTCDGCEPGQVMAHLSKHQRNQLLQTGPAITKEDKELLRQKELKQMKVKYGLKSAEYEEAKALKNPRYVDRAESRRQTVGSEGAFQRDDAPASVNVEIGEVNKGRKMLEKMGWKRGEGLGKDGAGIKDPIQLKIRKSQSGLGAGAAVSVDEAGSLSRTRTQRNFEKARERYNDTCQQDTPTVKKELGRAPKPWVKGEVTQ